MSKYCVGGIKHYFWCGLQRSVNVLLWDAAVERNILA